LIPFVEEHSNELGDGDVHLRGRVRVNHRPRRNLFKQIEGELGGKGVSKSSGGKMGDLCVWSFMKMLLGGEGKKTKLW